MKKIIVFTILCFFGVMTNIKACSPVLTPFEEWLNWYNQDEYIIVEGYFQSSTTFKVIRTSDKSIKISQEYKVFEYGPFGSSCEMYEMESNIRPKLIGNEKLRLLILYKERSKGKLVTPIFWEQGVSILNNRIVTQRYDYDQKKTFLYKCTTPLDELWKEILTGKIVNNEWIREE